MTVLALLLQLGAFRVQAEVLTFKANAVQDVPLEVCSVSGACMQPEHPLFHNYPERVVTVVGDFVHGDYYYLEQNGAIVSELVRVGTELSTIGLDDFVQGGFLMLGSALTVLSGLFISSWSERLARVRIRRRLAALAERSVSQSADEVLSLFERSGSSAAAIALIEAETRRIIYQRDQGSITKAQSTAYLLVLVRSIPSGVLS